MTTKFNEDIKNLLKSKKIEEANKLLGYNIYIEGEVIHGLENGRKINFPTINQELDENIFPNGTYISRTIIGDKIYKSMSYIGTHPTINQLKKPILETHLIGFNESIYGQIVKVELLSFLAEETKFNSLKDLQDQLAKFIIAAQNYNC